MKNLNSLLGLLVIAIGVFAGLYLGLWWAFIGGIVSLIQEIRADELVPLNVAFSVARIVFAGLIGWLSAIAFILPGYILMNK